MLRFLRKYNKIILAVFGTLLLVVFLIPEAIQRLGQYSARGGTTWATYTAADGDEETATGWDLEQSQQALRVMQAMPGGQNLLGILGVKEPEHWFLLAREAREAGLMGGPTEALSLLTGGDQNPRELISMISAQSQIGNPNRVIEVLNEMLAVQRLVSLYAAAGKFSDVRLKRFTNEEMLGVTGEYLLLRASAEADDLPEPTIEQIQTQFDTYKDLEPGAGDYGFGYRLPDRVKLEWIGITATNVRTSIERAGLPTSLEVRKHWLKNRAKFLPPPGVENTDEDAVFAAVEARVRGDLLAQMTREKLAEIQQYVEGELNKNLRTLPRNGNYRVLPDNWADVRIRLTALAESLQQEFGIDLPTYSARGEKWLTRSDVNTLPEIGFTRTDRYGSPRRLAEVVFAAKEFATSDAIIIQQGVAGPPMTATDGSVYFFRIVGTSPAHAPKTVDEVQEQVVRDLKLLAHHQRIAAEIDSLRDRARTDGFEALGDEYDSFPQSARNVSRVDIMASMQFGRTGPTSIPGLSHRPDANKKAVEEITAFGRDVMMKAIERKTPVAELPVSERLFTLDLPDALAVMIFRVTGVQPIFKEDYAIYAGIAMNSLLQEELTDAVEAFSYDALMSRHQFVLARKPDANADELGDPMTGEGDSANADTANTGS